MLPLKDLLRYAWAGATGKNIMYGPVYRKISYGHEWSDHKWAEIEPIQGQQDLYAVYNCAAKINIAWDAAPVAKFMQGPKWDRGRERYSEESTGRSSFTLAEARKVVSNIGQEWEGQEYAAATNQPFARRALSLQQNTPS